MKGSCLHPRFLLIIFLCGLVFGPPSVYSQRKEGAKRNVILITIDTLRADRLGCYGGQNPKTPNIDSLAERGVLFSRAFANTSTTLPSHTNILLGTTPNFHGVHENLNFVVSRELLTLAELLKANGYSTGAFVSAYPLDARFGLSQGFDIYDDNYSRIHSTNLIALERNAEAVISNALDWLKDQVSPWFLWIHCWDPHSPYDPPEPFKTQYSDSLYEGEIAYVDLALGNLFNYITENDLFDSILVIFTGDHGESLGEHEEETHGYLAYNSSIWIPLIIVSPEANRGPVADYVSHIDIFPTVCDELGIKAPTFLQGTSLSPALKGKKLRERPIYFESLYPYYSRGWAPLKGFILKEKKFIDSPIPEIYDLSRDFDELNNLAKGENTMPYAAELDDIIQALTPPKNIEASQPVDRETREKLASLGYVSSRQGPQTQKKDFTAKDDVKVLLPYINRIGDAWKIFKNGQKDEAVRLIEDIIEERDDIDLAYKQLAAIHQESGNTEQATATLEQGLFALPSNYELFIEYMKSLVSAQQFDKAIAIFGGMNIREAEYDPEIWNSLGTAYAGKGDLEMAIKAFEMGLSLDERHPELYNNLANALYSQSLKTKNPFAFSRSFELYKKAIELDPDYPAPYFGLGHAYREEGNLSGAIFCWQKTLELNPDFREAHLDLAIAYLAVGEKTAALDLFLKYKNRYSELLPTEERKRIDSFIDQCRK
jgi:arylsulfatase A-like enzyme/Flp pilus assembly protein TadD